MKSVTRQQQQYNKYTGTRDYDSSSKNEVKKKVWFLHGILRNRVLFSKMYKNKTEKTLSPR